MTTETQEGNISSREIALRMIAATNAQANTEMEGLSIPQEAQEDIRAWVAGRISIEEALAKAVLRNTHR